ncbi:hypothetical protein QMU90_002791 [Edwardsiella ictaluri]|uniref:Uncharacterized protein n=1 Tax=Edwardsiella ictaluri TaxID=67780 RepID=A0ABY8GHZ2_EDWIC|nr:hypothetical protein [Edwardsiella ictaluri]ELV7528902.1 hypothetical protein [Edwardsiella ictaluri]WFN96975.1 hypothetical protein MAY91_02235 [Edwardsiella ictaluri]
MAAIDDLQIHHNMFSLANRRRPSMNKSNFQGAADLIVMVVSTSGFHGKAKG